MFRIIKTHEDWQEAQRWVVTNNIVVLAEIAVYDKKMAAYKQEHSDFLMDMRSRMLNLCITCLVEPHLVEQGEVGDVILLTRDSETLLPGYMFERAQQKETRRKIMEAVYGF